MKEITIAIDGTSSTGKSSIAKRLAKTIGYTYIDTGAMYRCVALLALENGIFKEDNSIDEEKLNEILHQATIQFIKPTPEAPADVYLNGINVESKIRSMEVSSKVSPIAAIPFVREAMVNQQRAMGKSGGIVMDGRDIGTVVFPNAELKVFMTASAEVRAERRYKELQEKGMTTTYEEVFKNLQERDYIDSHRATSPLRQAEDAILIDNSHLTFEEEMEMLLQLVAERKK